MPSPDLHFRLAESADLPDLVRLLADDPLGAHRETASDPVLPAYQTAFATIIADPHNHLWVATQKDAAIAGMLQLTYIPYLTYRGRWRALIEGVRVDRRFRGKGIGKQLILHAIEQARAWPCHLVQLTTDRARPEALAFYESLGFRPTHVGLKYHFDETARQSNSV